MYPIVHRIVSGRWRQNGYIVQGLYPHVIIIDPGLDFAAFSEILTLKGLLPCAIINTHGHYDHIGSVSKLMRNYRIPFYLHYADAALLRQANLYRVIFSETEKINVPDVFLDLSKIKKLAFPGLEVDIVSTPGHTNGSVCFHIGNHLFTGDTLLPEGPGRVDLPGGSANEMINSQALISGYSDDILVCPGHGAIKSLQEIRQVMSEKHARSN